MGKSPLNIILPIIFLYYVRMARNIKTIYDSIIDYKESRPELSDLNSTSSTAIYKMWAYVQSIAIYTLELLWDLFKVEIEEILTQRINGTKDWYAQKSLDFQYGDPLTVLGNEDNPYLGYATINDDNKIITRVAYGETTINNVVHLELKVAKGDPETLQPLDAEEILSFEKYLDRIKFAGVYINTISANPDEMDIGNGTDGSGIEVRHDGVRSNDDVKEDVVEAINSFLVSLPFDGIMYVEQLRNAIQSVTMLLM